MRDGFREEPCARVCVCVCISLAELSRAEVILCTRSWRSIPGYSAGEIEGGRAEDGETLLSRVNFTQGARGATKKKYRSFGGLRKIYGKFSGACSGHEGCLRSRADAFTLMFGKHETISAGYFYKKRLQIEHLKRRRLLFSRGQRLYIQKHCQRL